MAGLHIKIMFNLTHEIKSEINHSVHILRNHISLSSLNGLADLVSKYCK